MNRDGHCLSLWQSKIKNYVANDADTSGREFDVAVVGGGITGLTTALTLQKAGKTCILIEAKNIGFGTTGGTTAHLNTYFETPFYQVKKDFDLERALLLARAGRESMAMIEENVRVYQIECGFKRLHSYLIAINPEQARELQKTVDSMHEVGHAAEWVDEVPLSRKYVKAARVPEQGQLHPSLYLHGLARAFEAAGGVVVQNCRVISADEGETIQVSTTQGEIRAKNLVYATHTPPGINVLHMRMSPYRSYVLAAKLAKNQYPDALIYDLEEPYHYYRTQEFDGEKFFVVGGNDHKTAHKDSTASFRDLEQHVRQHFDVEEIAFRWSSQLYEPSDGIPYIGHYPQHGKNVFVGTGFAGNGMMYGTITARVIHDLIVSGKSEYDALFNPLRIKPLAEGPTLVKENIDVAIQLVKGWIAQDKLEGLADLKRGDGKVVKYEGHSVAIYKDDRGKCHAVNPTCPHMLCAVDFNRSERSWDCPCHGSRFSTDGELITGPARKDLDRVELRESKFTKK